MSRTGRWSTQATVGLILVVLGLAAVAALRGLEDRYGQGEINRDEFLQRRDDLLGKSG
jgi:Short C-terminal domain